MVKLRKQRVHKAICTTCKGNGYLKIKDNEDPTEVNVHQCWDCDSEGEFYETVDDNLIDDGPSNKLH